MILNGPCTTGDWLFPTKDAAMAAFNGRPVMEHDTLTLYQGAFSRTGGVVRAHGRLFTLAVRFGADEATATN
jgi:hypothetical protein